MEETKGPKFVVVRSLDPDMFEREVTKLLSLGWKLHGPGTITQVGTVDKQGYCSWRYFQPMIRRA
jgi:hypothetical protein